LTEDEGHKLSARLSGRCEFLCPPKATVEGGKPKAKFSNLEIYFVKALIRFIRLWAAFLLLLFFAPSRGINPAKEK